jgi:hypothetical protein
VDHDALTLAVLVPRDGFGVQREIFFKLHRGCERTPSGKLRRGECRRGFL